MTRRAKLRQKLTETRLATAQATRRATRTCKQSMRNHSLILCVRSLVLSFGWFDCFLFVCRSFVPLRSLACFARWCSRLVWLVGCLFVCLFFVVTVSRRYEVLRVLLVGFVAWFVSLSQFTSGVEAGRVVQVIARLGEAVGEIGLAGGQVRGRMACYGI